MCILKSLLILKRHKMGILGVLKVILICIGGLFAILVIACIIIWFSNNDNNYGGGVGAV